MTCIADQGLTLGYVHKGSAGGKAVAVVNRLHTVGRQLLHTQGTALPNRAMGLSHITKTLPCCWRIGDSDAPLEARLLAAFVRNYADQAFSG